MSEKTSEAYERLRQAIMHLELAPGAGVSEAQLVENIRAFTEAVSRARPSGAKGTFLKRVALASTQGPGVRIDPASLSAS